MFISKHVDSDAEILKVVTRGIGERLRRVSAYAELANTDILYGPVEFEKLAPLQAVLTYRKLIRADLAIREHQRRRLRLFSPMWISRDASIQLGISKFVSTLWLPPIVEMHGGRFVVIDGHHRLYSLMSGFSGSHRLGRKVSVICLTNVNADLPAMPYRTFDEWMRQVKVDDVQYSYGRSARYRRLDMDYWRALPSSWAAENEAGTRASKPLEVGAPA